MTSLDIKSPHTGGGVDRALRGSGPSNRRSASQTGSVPWQLSWQVGDCVGGEEDDPRVETSLDIKSSSTGGEVEPFPLGTGW